MHLSVRIVERQLDPGYIKGAMTVLSKFSNNYVTRTRCKGKGALRTTILGQDSDGQWHQVIKI